MQVAIRQLLSSQPGIEPVAGTPRKSTPTPPVEPGKEGTPAPDLATAVQDGGCTGVGATAPFPVSEAGRMETSGGSGARGAASVAASAAPTPPTGGPSSAVGATSSMAAAETAADEATGLDAAAFGGALMHAWTCTLGHECKEVRRALPCPDHYVCSLRARALV